MLDVLVRLRRELLDGEQLGTRREAVRQEEADAGGVADCDAQAHATSTHANAVSAGCALECACACARTTWWRRHQQIPLQLLGFEKYVGAEGVLPMRAHDMNRSELLTTEHQQS